MGVLKLKYRTAKTSTGYYQNSLSKKDFDKFNIDLLGLGKISSKDVHQINALAVIFDLEGFTAFTNQTGSRLEVPKYLGEFLNWLFENIGDRFTYERQGKKVLMWGSLPFYGKFLGDGVLFLWDTDLCDGPIGIGNIAISLRDVCMRYQTSFWEQTCKSHPEAPPRLRAGIACGPVLSIGNQEFIGPCINMAARLQKLASLPFAISRRNFDPAECFSEVMQEMFIMLETPIRGFGDEEQILVYKKEFAKLPVEDKALFSIVNK